MEHQPGLAFVHTAEYSYIDMALKARWDSFCDLAKEIEQFKPRTSADFAALRESELERLRDLNPSSSIEDLLEYIDNQISSNADPRLQTQLKFTDRVMAEYVTVAFLAHALAESAINALLAIGLATADAAEVFSLVERADIKEKWLIGPKTFRPSYHLPKGSSLYETLQHLTRQRNAFVHYKIELEMHGIRKLEGSRLNRAPLATQIEWIKRFFNLPYDLVEHAQSQIPNCSNIFLSGRDPIQRFSAHARF